MLYVIDNNIISYFAQTSALPALDEAGKRVDIRTLEEVREELNRWRSMGAETVAWLDGSSVKVEPIQLGSPAHLLLVALDPKMPAKDRGERACTAWLATHAGPGAFVSHDNGALWTAASELHREDQRTIATAPFLRILREKADLPLDVVDAVAEKLSVPTWWAPWRSSQTAP